MGTSVAPGLGSERPALIRGNGWWTAALWGGVALCLVAAGAWSWLSRRSGPKAYEPGCSIEITRDEIVVSRADDDRRLTHGDVARVSIDMTGDEMVMSRGSDARRYARSDVEHVFPEEAEARVVVRLRGGRELPFAAAREPLHEILKALSPDPAHHAAVVPIGSLAESVSSGLLASSGCFVLTLPLSIALIGEIGSKLLAGSPIKDVPGVPVVGAKHAG